MFELDQSWELFGYDMRQLGRDWKGAWRDLLWGNDSPLRMRLDEVVLLRSEVDSACYQSGRRCNQEAAKCTAILLPDSLVLSKTLRFPSAVESDLDSVLALEVGASSPFAADDVGYGWSVVSREQSFVNVALVIVSMSAVMSYLVRQYDIHDSHAQEIWASVDGSMVVVGGFGERVRANLYRKRLLRCAAMSAVSAVLLFSIMAISTAFKGLEAQRFETMNAAVQREAADASRLRESLVSGNAIITAANEVLARYPNPHVEIARLTHLLGDDVSIAHFSMNGDEIRLRGLAVDAAAVMQLITKEPTYAEVTSPQAISRVGNTGFEQFSLSIRLVEGDSG